jgi:Coenzyme PQQ synthesis protein D (PqqD)
LARVEKIGLGRNMLAAVSDRSEAAGSSVGEGPQPSRAPQEPIRLREEIVWREIDGEVVVLDLEGAAYFTVSHSGRTLWPLVVGGTSVEELADRLVERFSLEREVAERDVRSFLDSLGREGLLERPAG